MLHVIHFQHPHPSIYHLVNGKALPLHDLKLFSLLLPLLLSVDHPQGVIQQPRTTEISTSLQFFLSSDISLELHVCHARPSALQPMHVILPYVCFYLQSQKGRIRDTRRPVLFCNSKFSSIAWDLVRNWGSPIVVLTFPLVMLHFLSSLDSYHPWLEPPPLETGFFYADLVTFEEICCVSS